MAIPYSTNSRISLNGYARSMMAYTRSQISSFVGLDEKYETKPQLQRSSINSGSSEGSDLSVNSVLHQQGSGLPSPAEA
jgi:hypothetical protein